MKYNKYEIVIIFLSLILLSIILLFKFSGLNYFWYSTFTDRALTRALNLTTIFQISGAETNFGSGARVPGGFSYYYLWFLIKFTKNIEFLYIIINSITVLSFIYLSYTIKKNLDLLSCLLISIFFFSTNLINSELLRFWNPVMGLHLLIFSYAFFIKYLDNRNNLNLFTCLIFMFLSTQFHISYFSIAFSFFFILLFYREKQKTYFFKLISIFIIAIFLCYLPNFYNLLVPFKSLNTIIRPNALNINQYFYVDYNFVISLLQRLYNMQSFGQVAEATYYNLPFMGILVGLFSYILIINHKIVVPNRYFYKQYLEIFGILIIITLILYSIGLTFGEYNYDSKNIVGYTLLYQSRYFLSVSPIFSIISGISFFIFINVITNNKINFYSFSIIIIILSLLMARTVATAKKYNDYANINHQNILPSYKIKEEIFDSIKQNFNFSKKDFYNKVAFSFYDSNQIVADSVTLEYLINTRLEDINSTIKYPYDGCVLSILSNKSLTNIEIKDKIFELNKFNIFIDKIILNNISSKKNNFKNYIISYKTSNTACMNSIGNSYIFNKKEKAIKDYFVIQNTEKITKIYPDNKNKNIYLSIPLKQSLFNLNIGIEFRIEDQDIIFEINGKRLRNKAQLDGYWETANILNSKLLFVNKLNNNKIVFNIHKGIIGNDLVYTPFIFKISNIDYGKYELYLLADAIYETNTNIKDGHSYDEKLKDKNIKIKLFDNLVVKK